MLAPEPFLEPRGTPFSVYHRARALSRLGHEIDLVTYPQGASVTLPNVHVYRVWWVPFIRRVKIGPSLAKLPLDALLFARAAGLLARRRYDCIHTHEEAGLFGAIFSRVFGLPHVHDMHSDLAEQMTNFRVPGGALLAVLARTVERIMLRSARIVIVICPELRDTVAALAPGKPVVLIENTAVAGEEAEETERAPASGELDRRLAELRRELALDVVEQGTEGAGPIFVYTGTFESYQGLELVVESMPAVLERFPSAVYVLAGGRPEQARRLAELGRRLGVERALRLPGQRPPGEMPLFLALADVLLSPRSQGTNTPLKIYSYLHAGKPILATAIRSHTQVLSPDVAELVAPTSAGLAGGALRLLAGAGLREQLARNAQTLADERYSYTTFLSRTESVYRQVRPQPAFAMRR